MVNLRESWLTGTVKGWDAIEAVAAARHVLHGMNEKEVKNTAKSIDRFLIQTREILEGETEETILENIESGFKHLKEVIKPISQEVEKAIWEQISRSPKPLINRYRTHPADCYNLWQLAIAMNGGFPPQALDEIPPDRTYAILSLYAAFSNDVLSAYKFAVVERAGLQMNMVDLEPLWKTGLKTIRGLKEGNRASAATRSKKSHENIKKWREFAIEKWPENPGYTVGDMAEFIRESHETDAAIGTIKQAIKGIKESVLLSRSDENRNKKRENL